MGFSGFSWSSWAFSGIRETQMFCKLWMVQDGMGWMDQGNGGERLGLQGCFVKLWTDRQEVGKEGFFIFFHRI